MRKSVRRKRRRRGDTVLTVHPAAQRLKELAARFPTLRSDHPIFSTGFIVGGRYTKWKG